MEVSDKALLPIANKVLSGERLSENDAVVLYQSKDIHAIGAMAKIKRMHLHGEKTFFVYNRHINYTNICINRCRFCAFSREPGKPGGFVLQPKDIADILSKEQNASISEIHVVGGINPELPFSYYLDLLSTIREILPHAVIKAFTAVEIDHLSRISGLGLKETIKHLKDAGLGMVPGGGAEVLTKRIHDRLFPNKIDATRWLEVVREIHLSGLTSNATMLYGHLENIRERVTHLFLLRNLQDETGGFSAFIPLAFHPKNTKLSDLPGTTGFDDLKNIAISRLVLDNFDHIKAYWVMLGEKTAQIALHFGADDFDGTIVEEKISHMAGATSAVGLTPQEIIRLIKAAGFTPVLRDAFYNELKQYKDNNPVQPGQEIK